MKTIDQNYSKTTRNNAMHSHNHQQQQQIESYQNIIHKYPRLIHSLLTDLLKIEGYSEVAIGFGTGINLDTIRKITNNNLKRIPKRVFFDILGLYARVFCDWYHFKD
jgi:CRISPR/Cas system CSM-associated protein Csm5 (group 7 of RAMP superfamily)